MPAVKRPCDACGGAGYVVLGAGLAALEDRYPDLPIREMNKRGWFDDVGDGEDVERVDRAFLKFFGEETHDGVRAAFDRYAGKSTPHRAGRDGR